MKISEYIAELEKVKEEVGDVEVQSGDAYRRDVARTPVVAYTLLLRGREQKPRYWSKDEGDIRRGEVVCRV